MAIFIDQNDHVLTQEEEEVLWKFVPEDLKILVEVGVYDKDKALAKMYDNVIRMIK